MIKLKDILNESNYKPNEPIGKVMTDKDHPPFLTEEQWMEKWSRDELDEGFLDNLNKWAKKLVFRLVSSANSYAVPPVNKRQVEILRKYMFTGNISNGEAKDLHKFIARTAFANSFIPSVVLFPFLGYLGAGIVGTFVFIWWKKHGIDWLTPDMASNNYIDKAAAKKYKDMDDKNWVAKVVKVGDKHYNRTVNKAIDYLEKKVPTKKYGKALSDKINKL